MTAPLGSPAEEPRSGSTPGAADWDLGAVSRLLIEQHQKSWIRQMLRVGLPGEVRDRYDVRPAGHCMTDDNKNFDLSGAGTPLWPSLRTRLLTETVWSGPGLDDVWVTYDAVSSLRYEITDELRYLRTVAHLLESSFRPYTPLPPRPGQGVLIWSRRYSRYFTEMCRGLTSSPSRAGVFHLGHAKAIYAASDPWQQLILAGQTWD